LNYPYQFSSNALNKHKKHTSKHLHFQVFFEKTTFLRKNSFDFFVGFLLGQKLHLYLSGLKGEYRVLDEVGRQV